MEAERSCDPKIFIPHDDYLEKFHRHVFKSMFQKKFQLTYHEIESTNLIIQVQ